MLDKDEEARKANGAFLQKDDKTLQPAIEGEPAEDERRLWRGVFSPVPERDTLFIVEIDLCTANLPAWEPSITINRRWASDDDK